MNDLPRYFDHAATSPLRERAREAMLTLGPLANPASTHRAGQRASALLEEARERIAACVDAHPTEVVLLSGGTEAVNLGLKGLWLSRNQGRDAVVSAAIEHAATMDSLEWLERQGATVHTVGCSPDSVTHTDVDLGSAAMATISWANNETGVLQPVEPWAAAADEARVPLHVDAIAALGHVPVAFRASGATCMSIAAHKVGGPVGAGALLVSRAAKLTPLLHGGGQQRGLRSGTGDVAGAIGFAVALEDALAELEQERLRLSAFAARIREAAKRPGVRITGETAERLPGTVHLTVDGANAEALTFLLDGFDIQASNGSACTAGVVQESHVVRAMGVSGAPLRLSMGWSTTEQDADALVKALPDVIERARASR
ncbi:cysteine desulfurase family protein [uncultured Agrococcus sp.]|uniref:cysteine desulfurase family protein n=1 Tax=uncultured Agrococcus sp. TaxID=382258 RepID=UPI0025D60FE5|nr:cysteine desulfurase family protein [uncultured Agrococcus sp.]